ncbi:hypothetical protein yc1106_10106 [Curvularia clavata]|uniref:NACHT domain-containing protein n=1 Tax=Curvularia clavata TaxID=95742 RepID=A0A9Q8ZIZ7_CURCL|nr:hypothetical protein yc1106_10106 [Curvularia clavata]
MVLEAFAALSLAANIVQFIDFSGKLFSKAREVHRSDNGFSKDHADLESAMKSLKHLTHNLSSSMTGITAADNVSDDEKELLELAKDCTKLADELIQLLAKVKGHERRSKWESFLQAIRIAWNENDINLAKEKLKQYQTRMTFQLLVILKQVSFLPLLLQFLTIAPRHNQSNVVKMLIELSDHVVQGEKCSKDLFDMKTTLIKKLGDIKSSLDDVGNKANDTSSNLGVVASTLSELAAKGTLLATEHRILKSLCFRSMKVRHAQIPDAHKRTFEWAYTSRTIPDDSCTEFKFAEWLRSGNGLYWIAGKAGSGKSTLVKFLYDNPRTISKLEKWAGNKDLITASFFFWNAGTEMQKSVEGLLQSLLFEILRKCPTLIPIAAPMRWEERCFYDSEATPWLQWELKDAFRLIQQQATIPAKFCLFVDGLDEYEGNHADFAEILQGLANSGDFKICVSSRPWNIFQEIFGQNYGNRLFLEELTRPDIEIFVRDTLESSAQFLSLREMDTRYHALVEEIIEKADGVFLWVFLILRSLLQGLVNCDRISELQRRIRLLPSKLEDYFLHILNTTDETYSERAAETFDIALQASEPLSLMTYSYLDEEDPRFAINAGIRPLGLREVLYRLRTMKRRLNARCNGLLEITNYDEDQSKRELLRRTIDDFWDSSTRLDNMEVSELLVVYKVEFLHRTVRDFLNTKEIQNMIKIRIDCNFQPLSAVCRAILGQIKALPMKDIGYIRRFIGLVEDLIYYARAIETHFQKPEVETLDELERTLFMLNSIWQMEGVVVSFDKNSPVNDIQQSFYECMVRNGLCGYITRKLALGKRALPSITRLLASALNPSLLSNKWTYYPSMVQLLIHSSKNERTHAWRTVELPALWIDFLNSIPAIWKQTSKDGKSDQLRIIQMLLEIGADPSQQHSRVVLWVKILEELRRGLEERRNDVDMTEEMEMIEKYEKIFLACDADH